MNYRHHFHAGNFADVVKHALLVGLVRALQQKPKGFLYLDTHAGRGAYDLTAAATGTSAARIPEWPDGIGRLWNIGNLPPMIHEYVDLVRQFDRAGGNVEPMVRYYPGSPWLAARLARPEDRAIFCERHPDDYEALRAEVARFRPAPALARDAMPASLGRSPMGSISAQEMDGYVAIRAVLPPDERRGLVLVDPPYEEQNEFVAVASGLRDGLKRFSSGVFALWYPLTQRARVQEFFSAIGALNPPPTLAAELAICGDGSERKLKGCGLLIVNPPWQFDREATVALNFLAPVLAQEPGAGARVTWIVPET